MRIAVLLTCLATAAPAWEFTPGQPCRLTHSIPQAEIELTYDPTGPIYTITLTRPVPWPDAPGFGIRFDGPRGRSIGTDRHVLSEGNTALSVTDTGFGNVLDGLQYNHTATAFTGDAVLTVPLEGAAGPVAAFRACRGALAS